MNIFDAVTDSKLFAPCFRLIEHGQVHAERLKVLPQNAHAMSAPGEAVELGPLRFRPRNPDIDLHFGDFQAPGLGIGAEGVELDFGVLVRGGISGVHGDSGHAGPRRWRIYHYLMNVAIIKKET